MPGSSEVAEPDVEADGTGDGPRATAREWAGLILLALPCLLVSFDSQALNLAVPSSRSPSIPVRPSCCGSSTATCSSGPGR
jgi:hypothetical protein